MKIVLCTDLILVTRTFGFVIMRTTIVVVLWRDYLADRDDGNSETQYFSS